MAENKNFLLLRKILKILGLSAEAIDDIVQRIEDLLYGTQKSADLNTFPYKLRDDFLSPAEYSFYMVLQQSVSDWALICPKVNLRDLFYAKVSDAREHRIFTNKIDRKHVDFVLCDPKTMKPLVAVELDDKTHNQKKRQKRDQFVDGVFQAAEIPLARITARRTYNTNELNITLRQQACLEDQTEVPTQPTINRLEAKSSETPNCPKCNNEMVLRTAKSEKNKGNQFWGCSNFPKCRSMMVYEEELFPQISHQ
jgi:NAD-dependent SIR2 family protein deacetylase